MAGKKAKAENPVKRADRLEKAETTTSAKYFTKLFLTHIH